MSVSASAAASRGQSRAFNDNDADLRNDVLQAFPSRLLDESSPMLDSLVSLLRVYASSMTAEDLYYKTEAILVSERSERITREVVEQVRTAIQSEWETKMRIKSGLQVKKAAQTPAPKQRAGLSSLFGITTPQHDTPVTPAGSRAAQGHAFVTPSAPVTQVSPINNPTTPKPKQSPSTSAQIIETLNPHIPPAGVAASITSASRVALAIGTDPKTWNYRYMFERPGIKGQSLDDEIESVTQAILKTYALADEDLADPAVTSQESVYVVGRVAPALRQEEKDAALGAVKLADGLILEVSRRIGAGSRTPMHLSKFIKLRALQSADGGMIAHSSGTAGQLGLFPGLIAGFRGRNGAGDAFVVEEIFMPTSLPFPASPVTDLLEQQHSDRKLNGAPLSVFVAAGPFTLDSDLDFAPWHRLMDQIERRRPDVVLLMGPFLPAQHVSLLDPDLDRMPQDIFDAHIGARLRRLCESSSQTTVILLPSTRDIVSPHAAWPQPMLDKTSLRIHKRVKCLPNPCVFSVNEVIFGTSTADVLRDLRSDELVIDVQSEGKAATVGQLGRDPISRSVRQVLHQKHFYPLYPASTASELPLDVTHSKLAQFGDVTPDVLLLPSVLAPFAKVVDGVVAVNPGTAAKGATDGRGTFAALQIMPMAKQVLQQAVERHVEGRNQEDATTDPLRWQHALYERARVDITRL